MILESGCDMKSAELFRKDFPILGQKDYIYFDNAATSQRPSCVIEAQRRFDEETNANPLRGLYDWSQEATRRYEASKKTVADFIGADRAEEIIYTRNTSESLNIIAYSYALNNLKPDDEIVISVMEHHSNILPWQMAAKKTGAKLIWLEINEEAVITKEEYTSKISDRCKMLCIGYVSNVMGVTNPVKEMAALAHEKGAVVVVDGAQSTPHMPVDVKELGADFYAFSAHKMLGPMGIGVLYGRYELLDKMEPFLRGGEMIEYVTRDTATWAELPAKFEAGTVNGEGAVGMEAGIEYLKSVGFDFIRAQEDKLCKKLMSGMEKLPHIHILGSKDYKKHNGIVTFTIDDVHPHDISSVLNEDKICIRAGHHCAQPLMQFLKVSSTARASLYFYNTEDEVDGFLDKLGKVRAVMGL